MARKFLTPIDLNNLELQNVKIQNLADNPVVATTGKIYFNTASSQLRVYNGTSWTNVGGSITAGDGISVAGSTVSLDLAATSGLEVASGDGLRIDLATTSGLELSGTGLGIKLNGASFASSGLGITSNGLYVTAGDGIGYSASGIKVALATTSGLGFGLGGLQVDLATTSGLEILEDGLTVDLATISGLELSATGLAAKAVTDGGISVGLSGLSVDLATTSGLEIEAGEGLRIDATGGGGLEVTASGIGIDFADTSGLEVVTSGLRVKLGTGLEFNGNAIDVDTDTIATKTYVDSVAQGLDIKGSVYVATTSGINVLSDLEA